MKPLLRSCIPALALLAACATKAPPPAVSPAVEAPPQAASGGPAREPETRSNVAIADDIRKACGIEATEARFAYDSANVLARDRTILRKLAECFTAGPLKGRDMRLVGHADPRGDAEYNYLLGQRRADSIKSAIVDSGMPTKQISTSSRGEDEAAGVDEEGWARDRRVDITLGT